MKKCIIFDMDGTLIDSSKAMTKSVNFVRDSIGLSPVSKEFLEYHINKPDENLPMIFYNTNEYKEEHKNLFKKHYLKEATKYIKLYDGIKEVLDTLVNKSTLYVATNAHTQFAKNMLKFLKIFDYFQDIVGSDSVSHTKPSPEMIDLILKNGSFSKDETVLIGDSTKDMLSAKSAGIEFIYAKWGYCRFEYEGISLDTPKDIISIFEKV